MKKLDLVYYELFLNKYLVSLWFFGYDDFSLIWSILIRFVYLFVLVVKLVWG